MSKLKLFVKNDYVKNDGKCNIKIRLSHDRKVRYLKTPYCIEPNLLAKDGRIKQRHPNYIELIAAYTIVLNDDNSILRVSTCNFDDYDMGAPIGIVIGYVVYNFTIRLSKQTGKIESIHWVVKDCNIENGNGVHYTDRDKYFKADGSYTEIGNTAYAKLKPVLDELSKLGTLTSVNLILVPKGIRIKK